MGQCACPIDKQGDVVAVGASVCRHYMRAFELLSVALKSSDGHAEAAAASSTPVRLMGPSHFFQLVCQGGDIEGRFGWCAVYGVTTGCIIINLLGSIVVSISACHAEDPGSIPGLRVNFRALA